MSARVSSCSCCTGSSTWRTASPGAARARARRPQRHPRPAPPGLHRQLRHRGPHRRRQGRQPRRMGPRHHPRRLRGGGAGAVPQRPGRFAAVHRPRADRPRGARHRARWRRCCREMVGAAADGPRWAGQVAVIATASTTPTVARLTGPRRSAMRRARRRRRPSAGPPRSARPSYVRARPLSQSCVAARLARGCPRPGNAARCWRPRRRRKVAFGSHGRRGCAGTLGATVRAAVCDDRTSR
jgi:hypothetical protein